MMFPIGRSGRPCHRVNEKARARFFASLRMTSEGRSMTVTRWLDHRITRSPLLPFTLYPLPFTLSLRHLAAQVDALDDVLDRLLFDEDIADLELVDDLTDDFGARVLVAIEAQEVGKLVHALAGDAVGRDLAEAPDLSAVFQEKLHL